MALPSSLLAQNETSTANPNQQLIQQLQQMQQKIKELEDRLQEVESREHPAHEVTSAADASLSSDASADVVMPEMKQSSRPQLNIRGYADVGFFANQGAVTPEDHSRFALGQFNLFMTSRISSRANVLAELIVEPGDNNAISVDLERLLFNYSVSDSLNISLGRYHTSIGYYNTAYHHSFWMQTTVARPFLFQFEDDGGILPVHNVGLSLNGALLSKDLGLHHVVEVGNGRTSRSRIDGAEQNAIDENGHKSLNLAMFVRPERWRGLQAGFSYYLDRLTPDAGSLFENPTNPFPASVAARARIDERILAAHVVYQSSRFEFLNEAVLIGHDLNGYRAFYTPGFYSQVSNRWGQVRPYFRYQYVNANSYEPVFGDVGLRQGPSAGVRFDFTESAAFKIEYDRTMLRGIAPVNGMATQVSFAF